MNLLTFEPLRQMIVKEFTQSFRDPKMRRLLIIAPIIQILIFGYVINTDVKEIPTAVYDLDNSVRSRELVAQFAGSRYFDVTQYITTEQQALKLLDQSTVQAVLRINHGFEEAINGGRKAMLQVILDGTDSNATSIVVGYAAGIAGRYNQQIGKSVSGARVNLEERAWFNSNLESRNFFMPGVVALILMMSSMTMSSMAIVREKEIGTIEQIIVTPITRLEFILGKMIPFAAIGFLNALVVTVVSILWFHVPFRGSVLVLFVGVLLFLCSTLGIGLLVSTVSHTQQQAMMSAFFFNNPFMLLSGFVFPISNMPIGIQWLTYLNPLRYFLIILRGVFLKGVGFGILWPQFLGLALLAVFILWISVQRFHKTAG